MRKKIIISLIIISAIMLFSMQLCTILFGNKPTVTITLPASNQTVNTTSLTVTGTIEDLDGDQTKVKVWIEDNTSIYAWDTGVTTGNFEVSLDLSSLSEGIYYVIAQGYDANNNVSDAVSVNFNYEPGGGGGSYTNILLNGRFEQYVDNFSGAYLDSTYISYLNNNSNGDWLDNWAMSIGNPYGFNNDIKIDLDGASIRYYSTANTSDGNAKFFMVQNISHTTTANTTLQIRFKINQQVNGGTNPSDSELKVICTGRSSPNPLASFSSLPGTNSNNIRSSLTVGELYDITLNLSADCGIPVGTYLDFIEIFVNCWNFDVTIYEIAIYEAP